MADADKKDWEIKIHPDVLDDLEQISQDDPKAAEALREMLASMHQAIEGVNSGQYANFEDGLEAITGQRPKRVDLDDADVDEDSDD